MSSEQNYRIFEALSHPTRVKILELIEEEKDLTFSSLKHRIGMESSGQLQHHLQKLEGFVIEKEDNGSFGLTYLGRKALGVYRESQRTGRTLGTILCLPVSIDALASDKQVGNTGTILRMLAGVLFLALTVAILVSWQVDRALNFFFYGIGFGIIGAPMFGFLGASSLLAGITRYPGCEITAIPNLLASTTHSRNSRKRYYVPCMITPFNLPNGRLLALRKVDHSHAVN